MQAVLACRTSDVSTLFPVPTSTALDPTRYNGAGQALKYNTLDVRRITAHAPGAASPPGSPERRALAEACAAGVLAALRAAHDAGVLHTDVRPTNIIWVEIGRAHV